MPILVCYYGDDRVTREVVDEEFDEEELFLTMMHRGARLCELTDELEEEEDP